MVTDRSESAQFLKDVSPLGAPLTDAQSAEYKALLIKEGVHTADVNDLLEALEDAGRAFPTPETCKASGQGQEPKP